MQRAVAIGLDLGGTKCLGVAVDDAGSVVAMHRQAVPSDVDAEAVLDVLDEVGSALFSEIGRRVPVGAGLPGLVDRDGVLRLAPNLDALTDAPIKSELERRLGVAVTVDNDATCATWGERCVGGGSAADDMAFVTLGTGIGAGLVLGGRLHRGAHGFAGEPGHLLVDPDGRECPCGKRGCWERYASGSAIPRLAEELGLTVEAGEEVTALARAGDATALEVMDRYAWWVAVGLGALVDILDVPLIVLGGGVVADGDVVLAGVQRHLRATVMGAAHRPDVEVRVATLGPDAGAIGAALITRDGAVRA